MIGSCLYQSGTAFERDYDHRVTSLAIQYADQYLMHTSDQVPQGHGEWNERCVRPFAEIFLRLKHVRVESKNVSLSKRNMH